MGGASSSRSNQWEKEVVRGRGLGEGAGNIVRQDTDEEMAREEEEQQRKKVEHIVRRHSMLKAQLIENAMLKAAAAAAAEEAAAAAGPEVDEDSMGAKKESFGASQHRQMLAALKQEDETAAGAGAADAGETAKKGPVIDGEVRDFGELRARITLQSSGDTCFSTDDLEFEAQTLETCFSTVALGLGLQEGQFECRVVDATAVHAPASEDQQQQNEETAAGAEGSGSSDVAAGAEPSSSSNQANSLVFRMTIRFFTTAEGFSGQLLEKMYTFLGYSRSSNGDDADEDNNKNNSDKWVADSSAPAPICEEFRATCEKSPSACAVRVGKVTQAMLTLATGAEARIPMSR